MTSGRWSTHDVELTADRVTKRFTPGNDGRAEREWRALTLLSAHAPGLAPEPLASDLAADRPVVVMTRLAGTPLRGAALDGARLDALARTVTALHAAVPPEAVPP
ncbi:MAG: phosphotransferase, partial [Streptomyces sp.]|nr:phosphotransferase [Streptomyces sp.]